MTAGLVILVLGFTLSSVLLQTNYTLALSSRSAEVVFLTRLTGMLLVGLIFCQIVLLKGYKKINLFFTVLILALILIHPLLTVYFTKLIYGKLDPFYPFTDMCVLCPLRDQIITLGRLAFWAYLAAIGAVILRATPWFKENWQNEKMTKLGLPEFGPIQNNISFNAEKGVTRGIHAEPVPLYLAT